MSEIGKYDSALQMFVEKPRVADINHLRFLRFKADRGDFGPKPMSAPKGEYLFKLTDHEIVDHIAKQSREEKLRAHIALTGGK